MISKQEIFAFSITPMAIKWLIGTVSIAALPIILRLLVWCFASQPLLPGFSLYSTPDIFLFSLIIYLSVMLEAKHIECLGETKNTISYICLGLIIFITILLSFAFLNDAKAVMKQTALLYTSIMIALVSFLVGFCFFYFFDAKIKESSQGELS
jgi:hypothetical protein